MGEVKGRNNKLQVTKGEILKNKFVDQWKKSRNKINIKKM